MAKSIGKGKKLDLIVSDVATIKSQLKKLVKQQVELAEEIAKLARSLSSRKTVKAVTPRVSSDNPTKKKQASTRRVVMQTSDAARSAGGEVRSDALQP